MINRRQLLKTLAISPFLGLQMPGSNLIEMAGATTPCKCINILLHGFFFMEFHGNTLFAVAPKISNHKYYFKDHGNGERPHHKTGIIDLSYLQSKSSTSKFGDQFLQFSRADVGQSGYFITEKALNECALVVILPQPNKILPLRVGQFTDFYSDRSGAVAKSIDKSRSSVAEVPLVTGLQYDPDPNMPFVTRSFYAEHSATDVSIADVNDAFNEAAYTFDKFDLALQKISPIQVDCNDQPQLPDEIDLEDETSLPELLSGRQCHPTRRTQATTVPDDRAVHVATCPQFGVNP